MRNVVHGEYILSRGQGMDFTKEELKLLLSKTPHELIDNSIKSKLPSGRKAFLTRKWLEKKSKFTIEDIKHARNVHPFWKERKMRGSAERNEERRYQHDYTDKGEVSWNEKTILKFIEMNQKDKNGRYEYRDHEMAKRFHTTIAGIQHYRRKFNLVMGIFEKEGTGATPKRIAVLIGQSELTLRQRLKGRRSRS